MPGGGRIGPAEVTAHPQATGLAGVSPVVDARPCGASASLAGWGSPLAPGQGRKGDTMERLRRILKQDDGMATTEYALVTVAAAAFAGVLIALIRSDEVRELLANILRSAFG